MLNESKVKKKKTWHWKLRMANIRLMEEILHHRACTTPCKEWDIYLRYQLVNAEFRNHQQYVGHLMFTLLFLQQNHPCFKAVLAMVRLAPLASIPRTSAKRLGKGGRIHSEYVGIQGSLYGTNPNRAHYITTGLIILCTYILPTYSWGLPTQKHGFLRRKPKQCTFATENL